MKRILLMLVTILLPTLIGADEPVQVPKGIRYKTTTDQINDAARQSLKELFKADATDEDVHALFLENFLTCGPGLWCDVKGDENLAKLTKGKVEFRIPIRDTEGRVVRYNKLAGKLFQTRDEVLVFWKAFIKKTNLDNLTIRNLNPEELQIFWGLISFDITEPIFIMESEKHKFVVMFLSPRADKPDEKLKIMWIDDFQDFLLKYRAKKFAVVED